MADLYQIEILRIEGDLLTTKVNLVNVQAADLEPKKNVALQFVTDAYFHMKNFEVDINLEAKEVDDLLKNTAVTQLEYFNQLLHDHEFRDYTKYISIAEQEVMLIKVVEEANWEEPKIKLWEELLYAGNKTEAKKISPTQTYYIRFGDEDLLKHLRVGLIWSTAMFDRED